MNERTINLIIWGVLAAIFFINIIRLGIEMSKHPLGNEPKK